MYFCPHLLNLVALANFMVTTYNTSWLQLIWRTKITAVVNFAKNRLLSNSNHKTISTSCISPNDHTLLLFPSCRIRRKVIPPLFRTEFVPFFFFFAFSLSVKRRRKRKKEDEIKICLEVYAFCTFQRSTSFSIAWGYHNY